MTSNRRPRSHPGWVPVVMSALMAAPHAAAETRPTVVSTVPAQGDDAVNPEMVELAVEHGQFMKGI